MKTYFFLIAFFLSIGFVWAQNQHESLTAKFFPDPDFAIQTPTNRKPPEQGLCTYNEVWTYLDHLAEGKGNRVRLEVLTTTKQGHRVPILYLGSGNKSGKCRIWFQGALHGNEPASSESLFMLLDYLLNDPEGQKILNKLDIVILPIANMEGYLAQTRVSGDGFDLNRDQTKFADPLSAVLKQAFIRWNPDAAFDFHEYQPMRKEYLALTEGGATSYYDVLFLPSENLNIPEGLRKMTEQFFLKNAEKALDQIGYSHSIYFSPTIEDGKLRLNLGGKSPQSSSTSYALSNAVSMLIEIRGIGLGRTSFARRTYCGFTIANSFLQTVCSHSSDLKKAVAIANRQTILRTNKIVITANEPFQIAPVQFIDLHQNQIITQKMELYNAMSPTPELVRNRPWAYILPASCQRELACLHNLGVKTEELKSDIKVTAEQYLITDCTTSEKEWEKIHPLTVRTKVEVINKTFPAGSILIPMSQENANYAAVLLEPESENGFVSFGITPAQKGSVLPVFRIIKK